jgi:hypothetical protein
MSNFQCYKGFRDPSPTSGAIKPNEFKFSVSHRTVSAQNPADAERLKVRFPKTIRYRRVDASIYGKTPNYPFYRIAYYVAGTRHVRHFKSYQEPTSHTQTPKWRHAPSKRRWMN